MSSNPLIAIAVDGHGNYSAYAKTLDAAIQYYSLADEIQLQAILINMTSGQEDFSEVTSRVVLLIMICTLTGNMIHNVARPIPKRSQAKTIVARIKRLMGNVDASEPFEGAGK